MQIDNAKLCLHCLTWRPLDHFRRLSVASDKRRADCRSCSNIQRKAWMVRNPSKAREYRSRDKIGSSERSRQARQTVEGKAKALTNAAKRRAVSANLPFELTWEIVAIFMYGQGLKCAQTGIAFDFSTYGTSQKYRKLNAPSIDRKNHLLGYTATNIQIVCWFYNAAKGTESDTMLWNLLHQTFKNRCH